MRFSSAFIVITALFISTNLNSQVWFDLGAKLGFGTSAFVNQNIWNDRNASPSVKGGNHVGGKIGMYVGNNHGINIEFLASKYNGGASYTVGQQIVSVEQSFNSFDIPVLYKYHSDEGSYMEVGVSFGSVKRANLSGSGAIPEMDPLPFYNSNLQTAIFGFGGHVFQSDNIFGSAGFRFGYTYTDIISEAGGNGTTNYYPLNFTYDPDPAYQEYKSTNPFTFLISIELNYDLGSLVDSRTGKRAYITL